MTSDIPNQHFSRGPFYTGSSYFPLIQDCTVLIDGRIFINAKCDWCGTLWVCISSKERLWKFECDDSLESHVCEKPEGWEFSISSFKYAHEYAPYQSPTFTSAFPRFIKPLLFVAAIVVGPLASYSLALASHFFLGDVSWWWYRLTGPVFFG